MNSHAVYGSNPSFVFSTATSANPVDHAKVVIHFTVHYKFVNVSVLSLIARMFIVHWYSGQFHILILNFQFFGVIHPEVRKSILQEDTSNTCV